MGIQRQVVERFFDSQGVEYVDVVSALRAQYVIDFKSCLRDHAVSRLEEDDYEGVMNALDSLYALQTTLQKEIQDAPAITEPVTDTDIE